MERSVWRLALILSVCLGVLGGCAAPRTPQPSPLPTVTLAAAVPEGDEISPLLQTGIFSLLGAAKDRACLQDIASALQAEQARICADLRTGALRPITVEVYPDQASFDRHVMNPRLKGYYACSGHGTIQMVSPANPLPGLDAPYEERVRIAVHELAHLVLDEVNPDLPTWLDEGAACAIGPHDVYDDVCRERFPFALLPSFHDLETSYDTVQAPDLFSYAAVDYIVNAHGLDKLNALLRAPDALEDVLGLSRPEFEAQWRAYMAAHYKGPASQGTPAPAPPAGTAAPTAVAAAPALDPRLQASLSKATQLWSQYRLAEAKALLEEIVAQDPTFPGAGRLLSLIEFHYYRNGERALALLQKAVQLPRAEASDDVLLGDVYRALGRPGEAIAAYERGIARDPANTDLRGRLGEAYLAQGDHYRAVPLLEALVALHPFASPAGERLHRLYVETGDYGEAYYVWQAANMAVGGTALPGDLGHWNALYVQALDAPARHLALGRAYVTMRLYDEAAVALGRAQQAAPGDAQLARELADIRTFLRFRDEMAAYLDSFYREQALAGTATQPRGLGAIYGRVAALFPDLKQAPYSDPWFYEINDALRRRFGALVRFQPVDGYLSVYFGYIAGSRPRTVSHWGKETTTTIVWLEGMVSRGFMYWYTYRTSGTGGWCFEPEEAVLILDGRYAGASALYRQATDPETRARGLADSRAVDTSLGNPDPLAVFYSPHLAAQLALKAVDEAIACAQRPGASRQEVDAAAILDLADAGDVGITAHEGQHALDELYLRHSLDTAENQEYRSKVAEMVYGGRPFRCLYQYMAPFLGAPDIPHGVANAWVFQDIVRQISLHPERYPEVDVRKNILLQLPALSGEQIRVAAEAAFETRFPERY